MQPTEKFNNLIGGTSENQVPLPKVTSTKNASSGSEEVSSTIKRALLLVQLQAEMAALVTVPSL